MKVYPECYPCMLERALLFCKNQSDEKKEKVMRELCKFFSKISYNNDAKTIELAYSRNKIVERITKDRNPMKELNKKSFYAAKKLYPKLKFLIEKEKTKTKRFKKALMIALSGNIVEFGVKGYGIDLKNLETEIFKVIKEKLVIDDVDKIYKKVKSSMEILYVTDNVPELIFDKIFIDELKKYGKVYVAPLSVPMQDDACVEDVKKAKIKAEIIPRGDAIGVLFEKCPEKFLNFWDRVDFIIAKGMACYETLIDYPEKIKKENVAVLFKAKCKPVAKNVGVKLGGAVAKIL